MTYLLSLSLLGLLCSSSNPQQDMVCTTTRPPDMRNVDVHYVEKNGVLTMKYCTERSSSPHLTASAPAFRSSAPTLQAPNPDCKDPLPVLPGYGYNILTGMPLSNGKDALDPGYLNAPVFEASYSKCLTTGTSYKTWSYPDQYFVKVLNSMTKGSQMSSMHDEHTFQKEAKSSLTVSGGYKGYGVDTAFTAGAHWESATSKFSEGETVEQRFNQEAWGFQSTLVPSDVPLSTGYLQTLCAAYLSGDWTIFFMSYGTHVTTDVTCGARYSQVTTFTRKKFEEITSNQEAYNLGVKASYAGATGSIDVNTENSKKARDMVESAASDQYIVSTGGNGATLDGKESMVQYQEAAHNYPAPLSSHLLAHDELIVQSKWNAFQEALTHYHANDPAARDVTPEKFTQKWVAALEAYCADDAHKCKKATSNGEPTPMALTPIHFESDTFGKNVDARGKKVVWFDSPAMKTVLNMDALVKISKIHTYCGHSSHGRRRLRGIQFEYFDGTNNAVSDLLGEQGDSDPDSKGKPWGDDANVVHFDEVIYAVEVHSGDNIDGIWFRVQNLKDQKLRTIGCGYNGENSDVFNIKGDQKLLSMQGTSIDMDGDRVVTQIQFRTYLTLFPNFSEKGAATSCNCALPYDAEAGRNGAYCSDDEFVWCDNSNQACTTPAGVPFPKTELSNQCVTVCQEGPIFKDQYGVAPCVCQGQVRTTGVCRNSGYVWTPYKPGCGCSQYDIMCRVRCSNYEATLPKSNLLRSAPSPTATHEELLQMLETKTAARNAKSHSTSLKSARDKEQGGSQPRTMMFKSARDDKEQGGSEPRPKMFRSARDGKEEPGSEPRHRMFKSTGTTAPATKDSTYHHSNWKETKQSVGHMVKDMSKELKKALKAELKEFLVKELKEGLANLTEKQIQLEHTITRMLLNEIESY